MAVVAADVQAYPAFAARTTAEINLWIAAAPSHIASERFGDDLDRATLLWICHELASTAYADAGGPVASKRVGDVAVTFAVPMAAAGSDSWTATPWGRMLQTLARSHAQSAGSMVRP